jgi:DNA-binding NtrC family response regulator
MSAAEGPMPGPGRPVVIADDDQDLREMIAEYLEAQGIKVLQAKNGLEVLLHVKRARPLAVVLDLSMPRLGGLEALRRIRSFDPTIRVIVVTGEPEALHQQAHALGAAAVLAKPMALPHLLAALRDGDEPTTVHPIDDAQSAPSEPPPAPQPEASRGRILVVDDEEGIREVLEEFLTSQRFGVRTVSDGPAAIRAIVEAAPDVVLLDIDMPGLKGTDALPTIRSLAPRTAVIMVSGTGDVETAKRALAVGAFDYVTKPVDFGYLLQSLESAFALHALEE